MILQSFYFWRRIVWELGQTWNISSQICGKLSVGGDEVGGDEVPEGEEGDEGGQQGAREQEDLVRGELHGGNTADTRPAQSVLRGQRCSLIRAQLRLLSLGGKQTMNLVKLDIRLLLDIM